MLLQLAQEKPLIREFLTTLWCQIGNNCLSLISQN